MQVFLAIIISTFLAYYFTRLLLHPYNMPQSTRTIPWRVDLLRFRIILSLLASHCPNIMKKAKIILGTFADSAEDRKA